MALRPAFTDGLPFVQGARLTKTAVIAFLRLFPFWQRAEQRLTHFTKTYDKKPRCQKTLVNETLAIRMMVQICRLFVLDAVDDVKKQHRQCLAFLAALLGGLPKLPRPWLCSGHHSLGWAPRFHSR